MRERIEIPYRNFDDITIAEEHVFSDEYRVKKEKILCEIPDRINNYSMLKIAMIIILVMVIPTSVYAAGKYLGFYKGAWSGAGRKSHGTYTTLSEKNPDDVITHPAEKYEDIDEEYAEETVGSVIEDIPFSIDLKGTKLTVTSLVKDRLGNAVVEYTLERKGGILPEEGDIGRGLTNTTSDYSFSMGFGFAEVGNGYSYKDIERSTDDKWYCYDYIIKDDSGYYAHISNMIEYLNSCLQCTEADLRKEYDSLGIEYGDDFYEEYIDQVKADLETYKNPPDKDNLVISYTIINKKLKDDEYILRNRENEYSETHTAIFELSDKVLETKQFISDKQENASIEISPISIRINGMETESSDIIIVYNDGTEYVISSDSEVNNYNGSYSFDGDGDGTQDLKCLQFMFNRLVKIEDIDYIKVDDVIYK